MAVLSVAQARSYAAKAGFTNTGLDTIVAIAQAESGLNTSAQGRNTDGSIDRGIVQINSRYHSEVTNGCAYDPVCAFSAAYTISSRGTNFSPWTTYTSGTYKKYLSSNSGGVTLPSGKQWYQYPITHGYMTSYLGPGTDTPHYALDLGTPLDTPFYFPKSGTIERADYQDWGGEIFIKPDDGTPEEYGYHFDQVIVKPGSHVVAGQVVGYTGGQNYGGHHPTKPQWSTGPHLHFGFWEKWVNTPMGQIAYGGSPLGLINDLIAGKVNFGSGGVVSDTSGGGGVSDTSGGVAGTSGGAGGSYNGSFGTSDKPYEFPDVSQKAHDILIQFPGFTGIAVALDELETFPGVIWYGTNPPSDMTDIGQDVGYVGNTLSNTFRSVLDTTISNTIPLAFRSALVITGLIIIVALIFNAIGAVSQDVAPLVEAAGPLLA